MIPALLTTILWSYCVIATRRSINQLGENQANFARITLAAFSLGLMAHFFGLGIGGGGFLYFFLSGVVGFGFGDIGLFYALPRLGSRLTLLMTQCLAAPIAGVTEWAWMGTRLSMIQVVAIVIILLGIVIALAPGKLKPGGMRNFAIGIPFGLVAAIGQGMGGVLSRKAYMDAFESGHWTDVTGVWESIVMGATSGYQRLIGGVLVIGSFYFLSLMVRTLRTSPRPPHDKESRGKKFYFVFLTAASGPILGITCFQWAMATTPSAIVQSIVAMTPLVVMPMSWFLEGDRPGGRAIIGSVISVVGVLLLAL